MCHKTLSGVYLIMEWVVVCAAHKWRTMSVWWRRDINFSNNGNFYFSYCCHYNGYSLKHVGHGSRQQSRFLQGVVIIQKVSTIVNLTRSRLFISICSTSSTRMRLRRWKQTWGSISERPNANAPDAFITSFHCQMESFLQIGRASECEGCRLPASFELRFFSSSRKEKRW